MSSRFVHLPLHSEFSLTDSTIRVGDLVAACARGDMPAVALTDQANLFALVKFQKAAEAAGIKPIAGCDLWLADPEERGRLKNAVRVSPFASGATETSSQPSDPTICPRSRPPRPNRVTTG